MAKNRESVERRQRERAKQQKAIAKREQRLNKNAPPDGEPGDETDEPAPVVEKVDEAVLLERLAALHASLDNHEIGFEDFEIQRQELLSKLQVD
jgi:hypothetical protein